MRENSPSENDEERRTDKRKYVVLHVCTLYTVYSLRYESFVSSFTPKYVFVIDPKPYACTRGGNDTRASMRLIASAWAQPRGHTETRSIPGNFSTLSGDNVKV